MKPVLNKRAASLALLLAAGAVIAWQARHAVSAGMLVLPPHPQGVPTDAPPDVRHFVRVVRPGADVRAWVFDPATEPRGTLLLLHGIRDSKSNLVSGARTHVAQHLRVVAVDSRGHGESSGRYLTYGVEEARDLEALVDELERRHLLVRPLSVVGSSYGAATALLHAARDVRVHNVVAIAPFASLREVVPAYLEWILGSPARWIPSSFVTDLVDRATQRAGFNADDACPRCIAPRIRARTLLVHSRSDERISWQHCVRIRDALRTEKRLLLVDGVGHVATGSAAAVPAAISAWIAPDDR